MRKKLLDLAQTKGDLPPLPEILNRLESKIDDPDSSVDDVVELIQTEPVLSGRLIKLANSVFFCAGREKTGNISTAVGRLGLKMVLDLAYTLEMPKLFARIRGINQLMFWQHSLAVAVCSRSIGWHTKLPQDALTHIYLAGLMHDIGIMVFAHLIPDEYAAFLKGVVAVQEPLHIQEEKRFGIAHPELGATFVKKWWPVGPEVIQFVRDHHLTLKNKHSRIVIAANDIVNSLGIGNGTSAMLQPCAEKIEEVFDLPSEEFQEIIEEAKEALEVARDLLAK